MVLISGFWNAICSSSDLMSLNADSKKRNCKFSSANPVLNVTRIDLQNRIFKYDVLKRIPKFSSVKANLKADLQYSLLKTKKNLIILICNCGTAKSNPYIQKSRSAHKNPQKQIHLKNLKKTKRVPNKKLKATYRR